MKNLIKLIVVAAFGTLALGLFLNAAGAGSLVATGAVPTPTPPRSNTNAANAVNAVNAVRANTAAANAAAANAATPAPAASPGAVPTGGKKIPKDFVLGRDSLTEYGDVPFDHDTHAFKPYSPDGKSVVACVECHHTDQPKSALKPPLFTSERDVVLTFETWQASNQKVSECRSCHFQDGNVPDDKEMPTATYIERGKSVVKDLNNELAYHINCNTCHDEAAKLRPEVKGRPGFATSKDCKICHKPN